MEKADLEVYSSVGIDLTRHFKGETTGLRVDAAVRHWFEKFPWEGKSLAAVEDEIITTVERLMLDLAKPKPGATELVQGLFNGGVPIAVCSSSPLRIIEVALTALGIRSFFDNIHSAESDAYGKPHPAAYLSTAKKLGINPTKILVFEDSLIGAIAGKAARMKVIAVPEHHDRGSSRFDFCDLKLDSLNDFDLPWFLRHRVVPGT